MVTTSDLSWILPIIMTVVSPLLVWIIIKRTNLTESTATKALTTRINLENMEKKVDTVKDEVREVDRKLDVMTVDIKKTNEKIWDRIETVYSDTKLHSYRLNVIEDKQRRNHGQ